MKQIIFALLFMAFLTTLSVFSEDAASDLEQLKKEREQVTAELHSRRMELIQNTPELKTMHDKIIAMHKELALRLEKDREMSRLLKRFKDADDQLKKLESSEPPKNTETPAPPLKDGDKKDPKP